MYVCNIYMNIYTNIHILYVYITAPGLGTDKQPYVCLYISVYVYVYVYVCLNVCMCVCVCMFVYIYIYISIYIHTYIHILYVYIMAPGLGTDKQA